MEKQGFRFIILRVLAHRLQNLADFVSRQVVEEERPVPREQANSERTDTGSVIDASRVVSSPESEPAGADAEHSPAHWLAQAGAAEPPTEWLARVQKAAPELLVQKVSPRRVVPKQFHRLAAEQADDNEQMRRAGAEQGTILDETVEAEEDNSGLSKTSTHQEGASLQHEMHEPASSRNISMQSPTLPSASIVGGVPVTNAAMVQRGRLIEILQAKKASSELAGQGKPEREEDERQQYTTDVPASLNSVVKKHDVESVGQEREPMQIRKPGTDSTLTSTGKWPGQPVKQRSSPWEERPGISANQQVGYNVWSQAGILEPSYGQRWPRLSEADEYKQVEMRWLSLPEPVTTDGQDWEMARRAWERQQRLDEEQRGNSWNA